MEGRKRRILLVDDEPSIIKIIGKRLEVEGFEVVTAVDGQEALAKAQAESFDIVVLDLMLPKVNGFEVCAALKQHQRAKDVPIIAIYSGRGDQGDADRCLALGAAAYVRKGQGAGPLLTEIRTLLGEST